MVAFASVAAAQPAETLLGFWRPVSHRQGCGQRLHTTAEYAARRAGRQARFSASLHLPQPCSRRGGSRPRGTVRSLSGSTGSLRSQRSHGARRRRADRGHWPTRGPERYTIRPVTWKLSFCRRTARWAWPAGHRHPGPEAWYVLSGSSVWRRQTVVLM